MIKLVDILKEITEAKQVGDVYHFTSLDGAYGILTDGFISANEESITSAYGNNGQISVTRNKNLDTAPFWDYDRGNIKIRLKLDGDKISNKYKIRPDQYSEEPDYEPPAYLGKLEFEEKIVTRDGKLPVYPYLKSVTIYLEDEQDFNKKTLSQIENILKEKNIPYEIKES